MGYTLLPELATDATEALQLRRFAEPQPVREVSLVSQVSYGRMGFLNALAEAIRAAVPSHLTKPAQVRKIKWR
jgi:LysR family hydrogen peroxide-inducible transcriptional activator